MKPRAIVLALASVAAIPANSAHAADDFCSRLIVQAVNQFCQLLPNGLSLCQPVALVAPSQECATPGQQPALVPMGAPTLRPLAPWAAPYANIALPKLPSVSLPAPAPAAMAAPTPTATSPETAPASVAPPAPPADEEALRLARQRAASPTVPLVAAPTAPVAPAAPTPPDAPPRPLPPEVVAATPPVLPARIAAPASATGTATVAVTTTDAAGSGTPPVATSMATPDAVTLAPPTPMPATPTTAPTTDATAGVADDGAAIDALAHFEFDSATLTALGRAELDAWLAAAPKDKPLRVSGHADRLGPEPYNLKLSLRRAQAVKQYLIGKGVNPRRIQLEAKGESEPVKRCKGDATPSTKQCLAPNRRVEILPE